MLFYLTSIDSSPKLFLCISVFLLSVLFVLWAVFFSFCLGEVFLSSHDSFTFLRPLFWSNFSLFINFSWFLTGVFLKGRFKTKRSEIFLIIEVLLLVVIFAVGLEVFCADYLLAVGLFDELVLRLNDYWVSLAINRSLFLVFSSILYSSAAND